MRKLKNRVDIWLDEPSTLAFLFSSGIILGVVIGVSIGFSQR